MQHHNFLSQLKIKRKSDLFISKVIIDIILLFNVKLIMLCEKFFESRTLEKWRRMLYFRPYKYHILPNILNMSVDGLLYFVGLPFIN